jgi:UDP-N-acetylglucosamine 2-epimerase (non-hydrolysing)
LRKILTIFGTRPEAIKLGPVIQQLESNPHSFQTFNVSSGQHTTILQPFIPQFGIRVDCDLQVMEPNQTPSQVCARVLGGLDSILEEQKPDLILVQGDTSTALAGALAGFYSHVSVGHVEAGLRTGDFHSPFPEEMNRRLISNLATYHFAATPLNYETLIREGVEAEKVFVTGNPVVDALRITLQNALPSTSDQRLLTATHGMMRIMLTAHRRETFGDQMIAKLRVLRRFVEEHDDVALIFPMHPNPEVVGAALRTLTGHARIHLIDPQDYDRFIYMLSQCWLIVSDSGGVQEEAPTLQKPLLILRESTERPETVQCGVARMAGTPARLKALLEEAYSDDGWFETVKNVENPFGRGDSGERIVQIIAQVLEAEQGMMVLNGHLS